MFQAASSLLVERHGFAQAPQSGGAVTFSLAVSAMLGLSRSTVACTVAVIEDRSSTKVTISGQLSPDVVTELVAAISALDSEASTRNDVAAAPLRHSNMGPSPMHADDGDGWARTQIRSASARTLVVADQPPIMLQSTVVIGRDPALSPADGLGAVAVFVEDRSVSKTHAAFGVDDGGIWVEDRHSTNGTWLINQDGEGNKLTPGVRAPLRAPATVRLGQTTASVL